MEIVFRILWSVVLGGLIYGSANLAAACGTIGRHREDGTRKSVASRGLAWINAVVILVIGEWMEDFRKKTDW